MSEGQLDEGLPASPEQIALNEAIWKAFNDRDWDRFFSLATEDYVTRSDPKWPGGGEYQGRDEVMRFLEQVLEPWDDFRFEPLAELRTLNGRTILRGRWVARGRSTGLDTSVNFTVIGAARDGRASRVDFFIEHEDALRFAASEPPPD